MMMEQSFIPTNNMDANLKIGKLEVKKLRRLGNVV